MKSEKPAAPRRGLFMAGSSLGVLTLLMAAMPAAVVMAPATALAADECGVQAADGDPIVCPAGAYTGITYTGNNVPVTLQDDVIVGANGINLLVNGAATLNTQTVTPDTGDLQIHGSLLGIVVIGDSVTVDLTDNDSGDAPGLIDGSVVGILATGTGAGGTNLNLGNVEINAMDPGFFGISMAVVGQALGTAPVTITATGDLTSQYTGVVGLAQGGQVTINVGNVFAGDTAISGATLLDGGVDITANGQVVGDILATTHDGNINVNTYNSVQGDIIGESDGAGSVNLNAYGDAGGDISGTTGGAGGVNIYAGAVGGAVTGSSANGGWVNITTGDVGNGVMATAMGGGSVSVSTGNVAGAVTASADTMGSVGIFTGVVSDAITGTATGGGGVDINAGGAGAGITGTADTGGAVSINVSGDVTGNITATTTGAGAVTVTAANVTGTGTPIVATSDSGDVSVTLNGTVTGDSGYLAQLSTTGSATIGIGSGVTAGQADFDITAGNMLTVNNGGTWTGATDFTGYTSGHFNNMGTWDAAAITFTDGDDSFSNSGTANFPGAVTYDFMGGADSFSNSGTMTAGDLTLTNLETFDNSGTLTATSLTLNDATSFNNGGTLAVNTLMLDHADTFSNGGTLVFGTTAGASTLSLPAVTSLTNTGTIVFGGTTTATDGETNDRIAADGADFTGGGTLLMDVNLNGGNQEDCSAATVADCLSLADGSVSGVTTINLNAVGGAGAGGLNRIVLVDVSGGTAAAGAFKLASEATPQSLFFYRLDYDAANQQYALDGIPGQGIFEFPQISTSAQNLWYSSTGTYFERQADLRNQVNSAGGPGVWIKVNHVVTSRDVSLTDTHGSDSFDYLLNHKQTSTNVIGGLDLLQSSDAAMSYDVGVSAGHLDSKVDFSQGSGTTDLEGVSFGAYATLLAPSYFLDGVVQANRLDVDQHGDWNTGGFASGKAKSLGAQVEGGWRFHLGEDSYLEPLASLAYVTTKFDDFALPGGSDVNLDDAKSMRGSLGLRVSGSSDMGPITVNFSGIGRHWQEFKGENKGVLESAGRTFALGDDFNGSFDELGVGVSFVSKSNRVSGFFSTSVKFAKDYSSSDNTIGVRIQF